jgi:hypothetical protein
VRADRTILFSVIVEKSYSSKRFVCGSSIDVNMIHMLVFFNCTDK